MKKLIVTGLLLVGLTSVASANMNKVEEMTCDSLYAQVIHNYKNAFQDKSSGDDSKLHAQLGMFTMELYKECIRRKYAGKVLQEIKRY